MVKRAALINYLSKLKDKFPRHFDSIDLGKVEIYIDVEERSERRKIVEIIREYQEHFVLVLLKILQNKLSNDFYAKEPHGTYAIKFKNKKTNPRIYCLEFKDENSIRKVVMVRGVWNKQDNKLDKSMLTCRLPILSTT